MSLIHRFFRAYREFTSPEDVAKVATAQPFGVGAPPEPLHPRPPYSFDYPVAYNTQTTPKQGYGLSVKQLRNMARYCELVRIAIQMRKEQIRGLDWDITVVPGFENQVTDERRNKIREFFRHPDPLNDVGFSDWLAAWLEDLFVIDAPTLLVVKDRAGRLAALPQMDGGTIKPVLTETGFVPQPPYWSYVQVIKGEVTSKYTKNDLLYTPYNVQPDSPYGFSPTEMVVTAAHISLKRELYGLNYYTEGSVPEHVLVSPPGWNAQKILEYQQYLDDLLSGNMARRHKFLMVPGETEPKALKQPDFSVQQDEWLARIIGAVFGIAPHLLLRQRTKQQAGAMESQQTQIGLDPLRKFISHGIFTQRVIRELFGEPGLQFTFLSDKAEQEQLNLERAKVLVPAGGMGIDELRQKTGDAPLGLPPYIKTSNGVIFLNAKLIARIASGEVDFVGQQGGSSTEWSDAEDAADAEDGDTKSEDEKPEPEEKKVRAELDQWKKACTSDIKRGQPLRRFHCIDIPESMAKWIREQLSVSNCDAAFVTKVFSEAKQLLKGEHALP